MDFVDPSKRVIFTCV
jgi:hypothetical protein